MICFGKTESSIPNPLTVEDVDKQKQKECERSRGAYPIIVTMVFVNMQVCSGTQIGKVLHEKHILSLIPFIPKLVLQVPGYWKSRTLQVWLILVRN